MRDAGIAARIALVALAVTAVVVAIIAVGVLRVGADAFAALMVAAGDSATEAHRMFDESVAVVLVAAGAIAVVVAILLAMLFARRIARPIERLAMAADRIAGGELGTRVPEEGPPELRSVAASYNQMADRLAEQEDVRREFVVNASHELRTPLTNLQGYLEALRDGVLSPAPEVFDSLREEVDRLRRLAASLDVLAGADHAARAGATVVDLGTLVRSSVDLVRPALARRSIRVDVEASAGIAVVARLDDLAQVMANLLQNAVRYTPEGGHVRVALERDAAQATVRVANTTAAPIPAEDLPRVWERFYRVEKSRDRSRGGAGIGLAIVKRLIEDAGGTVGASSDSGSTTFWFSLPNAPSPEPASKPSATSAPTAPSA